MVSSGPRQTMLRVAICRSVLLGASALLLATSIRSSNADTATLFITDEASHPLNSAVFGQFLERPSWGKETGPETVADALGKLSPEVETHLVAYATLHLLTAKPKANTAGIGNMTRFELEEA